MDQPTPDKEYPPSNLYVKGQALKVVDRFIYLGNTLSRKCTCSLEILNRIKKNVKSFGNTEKKVWSQRGIKLFTKIIVYRAFCYLASSMEMKYD